MSERVPGQVESSTHAHRGYRVLCGLCKDAELLWVLKDSVGKWNSILAEMSVRPFGDGWRFNLKGLGWCCPACAAFLGALPGEI
jgi:hypothetical protein